MKQGIWIYGTLIALLLSGCVAFQDADGNQLQLGKDDQGYYLTQKGGVNYLNAIEEFTLRALVKGSIYESGEAVSVFGTCLDADDQPVSNVTAYFSSWYPNGTQLHSNITMTEFQPSYYLYNGTMNPVQGTYLTELTCLHNPSGQVVRAFGEWQNPYWVARIALLNETISNLNITIGDVVLNNSEVLALLQNHSEQLLLHAEEMTNATNLIIELINNQTIFINDSFTDQNIFINTSFNTTWNLINDVLVNLTLQLGDVENNILTGINNSQTIILQNITSQFVDVTDLILNVSIQVNDTLNAIGANFTELFNRLDNIDINLSYIITNIDDIQVDIDGIFANLTIIQNNLTDMLNQLNNITNIVIQNNELLQNLTLDVADISIQIGNLTIFINDSFEIVFDKLDEINQTIIIEHNITNTIIRDGFNNTNITHNYIIDLLLNITGTLDNITAGPTPGGVAFHEEFPNPARYFSNWNIFVNTYNTDNLTRIHSPEVQCLIDTTITPTPQLMTPVYNEGTCEDDDEEDCRDFKFSQFINVRGTFLWNVNCTYV